MYDIDKELEKIIRNSIIERDYFHANIEKLTLELLAEYIDKLPDTIRIAIRGGGEHTKQLLNGINNVKFQDNIAYIIDNNACNLEKSKYKTITMDEFADVEDVDLVIISSYAYREEMKSELKDKVGIVVFDIYDYLKEKGLNIKNAFYYKNYIYDQIVLYRQRYRKTHSEKIRQYCLRKLIAYYLNIRDFVKMIELSKIYISKKYVGFEEYIELLGNLMDLLKKIQIKIANSSKKHIIINLIDALSTSEIQDMKYLNNISSTSLFFKHSFTMTPWTRPTLAMMFNKKEVMDDSLYTNEVLINKDSKIIKQLEREGYRFVYIGTNYGSLLKIFHEELFEKEEERYEIAQLHWKALKILSNTSKPCCIFIHSIEETHAPYRCSILDEYKEYGSSFNGYWPKAGWKDEGLLKQVSASRSYVDKQLEWVQNFYNKESINIYMSDHGKANGYPWEERRVNNVLIIKGKSIISKMEERLFSLYNFSELIGYILEPTQKKYENIFSEYIKLQMIDVYEEGSVEKLLKGCGDNLFGRGIAYRGVRTYKDIYIRYVDGEESYFLLENEQKNCINQLECRERVQELRKIAGQYFVDIYAYDKFIHSRKLRDTIEK